MVNIRHVCVDWDVVVRSETFTVLLAAVELF